MSLVLYLLKGASGDTTHGRAYALATLFNLGSHEGFRLRPTCIHEIFRNGQFLNRSGDSGEANVTAQCRSASQCPNSAGTLNTPYACTQVTL